MFWFKRCPRCSGDLFEEADRYGCFITCMQCGFSKDTTEKLTDPGEISLEPVEAPITHVDALMKITGSFGGSCWPCSAAWAA